jgi:hypothetical protein
MGKATTTTWQQDIHWSENLHAELHRLSIRQVKSAETIVDFRRCLKMQLFPSSILTCFDYCSALGSCITVLKKKKNFCDNYSTWLVSGNYINQHLSVVTGNKTDFSEWAQLNFRSEFIILPFPFLSFRVNSVPRVSSPKKCLSNFRTLYASFSILSAD